jgi:cysteine sulfinate desulfinase/cysteine desulfurase-like protein
MPVYLVHNATTPFDSRVLEAMMPHLAEHHGKPSSVHGYGRVPPSTECANSFPFSSTRIPVR